MSAATSMMTLTPSTTPNTVSALRSLCVRNVSMACFEFSPQCARPSSTQSKRCGENSEEETNQGGDNERNDDRAGLHLDWNESERADEQDCRIGPEDADHAAHGREHSGLGHELKQNVFFARAKRTSNANFACALRDACQHDVHDDDAADDHKDADDADGCTSERSGEVMPKLHDGIGTEKGEIVRRVVGKMTPGTHQHAGFILSGFHHFRTGRLDENGDPVALAMKFASEG